MMLMTQPVCRQSQHNYMQCLDLINTAENLIRDYANASYPTTEIETKVRMGDYNVGNSVAYLTREDSAIETMPDVLKKALASKDIDLTVGKLADLGQCEYVWANVGCLTVCTTYSRAASLHPQHNIQEANIGVRTFSPALWLSGRSLGILHTW